jgi:hypothetical protein
MVKVASNCSKQIETKLNDEIKAGLLSKYKAEAPDGLIRISTCRWDEDTKCTGILSTEQGDAICSFTMDNNLNLCIAELPTKPSLPFSL